MKPVTKTVNEVYRKSETPTQYLNRLKVSEASIEKGITTLLELDGWRSFKMEQNFSERKMKCVGEAGMPDRLHIRYSQSRCVNEEVMWIEHKARKGRLAGAQKLWHAVERKRGALTLIAGQDFEASVDGFLVWYRQSGLMRRKF